MNSDSTSFLPGTVWCWGEYYVFVVLEDDRVLCLDDSGVDTTDIGKTFMLSTILKEAERVA